MQAKGDYIWHLASGDWRQDSQIGYVLEKVSNNKISSALDPSFTKQLLNLPTSRNKNFPSEFNFDPDTGEILNKEQVNFESIWIAPYGQSIDKIDQPKERLQHGLQLSSKLRSLNVIENNTSISYSEPAEIQIPLDIKGSFEFLSICIGTRIPQLIALDKLNGSLHLFNEDKKNWYLLVTEGSRLGGCPKPLQQYWSATCIFNEKTQTHEIYLPTAMGLAHLIINGLSLSYSLEYSFKNSICLGQPVLWNKKLLVPIHYDNKVQIVDVISKEVVAFDENISSDMYFERAVYTTFTLIWVGKAGQLVVESDTDNHHHVKYIQWLSNTAPDFRFGVPFLDESGCFYQLCSKDDGWSYVQLNSAGSPTEQRCSTFRFTTGKSKYNFEEKIARDIWSESNNIVDNQKILVPFIEDINNGLILGIRFEDHVNQGVFEKLNDESEQAIILLLDTNNGQKLFHRLTVKKPLESRFFYHRNHLYFYNSSVGSLLGWEAQP